MRGCGIDRARPLSRPRVAHLRLICDDGPPMCKGVHTTAATPVRMLENIPDVAILMFAVVLAIPFLIVADGLLLPCVPVPHRPGSYDIRD